VTASRLGSTTLLLVYYDVKEAWYLLSRTSVKQEKFKQGVKIILGVQETEEDS
jgi:hypothetical protein